jgi:shikimate kinase
LSLNNIFLIGYRCTGKTTVGRCLADKLGWSFIDTDALIVQQQKMSIREIVGAHGWENFRQMERDILKTVCDSKMQVVATGGGIVLNEQNVQLMRENGNIIWLRAEPETIKNRMLQDEDSMDFRPALTSNDSLSEIEETLQLREPLYQKAMDFSIDTDDHDIREVTSSIFEKLYSIQPKLPEDRI